MVMGLPEEGPGKTCRRAGSQNVIPAPAAIAPARIGIGAAGRELCPANEHYSSAWSRVMSSVAYTGFTILMILVFVLPMAFFLKQSARSK
jgi:hypothetical protein